MKTPTSAPASSANSIAGDGKTVTVSYLTEQTSHHPPVSAFYIDCPEKGISAKGYDQLSAKFTGTSVRVVAGAHNLGIFITLKNRDNEEYQLTHPAAYLGGILRGKHLQLHRIEQKAKMSDRLPQRLRRRYLLHYMSQDRAQGYSRIPGRRVARPKPEPGQGCHLQVRPQERQLDQDQGCPRQGDSCTDRGRLDRQGLLHTRQQALCQGRRKCFYLVETNSALTNLQEKHLIIDLNPLFPVPKIVPPMEEQLPNESLKFWEGVTNAIVGRQYNQATTLKTEIEDKQRAKAAERKEANKEWKPRFFTGAVTPVGRPDLTKDGEIALQRLHEENYKLEPNVEYGA